MDLRDKESANILSCLSSANIFIEAGIEAGGVFVHCFGGRSRSAAFITAFIMSSTACSYEEAHATVFRVRPLIAINKGFEMQLRAYADANYDVYVAEQKLLQSRISMLCRLRSSNAFVDSTGADSKQGKVGSDISQKPSERGSASASARPQLSIAIRAGADADADGTNTKRQIDTIAASPGGSGLDAALRAPLSQPFMIKVSSSSSDTGSPTGCATAGANAHLSTTLPGSVVHNEAKSEAKGEGGEGGGRQGRKGRSPALSPFALQLRKHIPLVDAAAPNIRLSRPKSRTIRVIPPLRGLGSCFCCSWCGGALFSLASVIRPDPSIQSWAPPASDAKDADVSEGMGGMSMKACSDSSTLTAMGPPAQRVVPLVQEPEQEQELAFPTYVAPPQSTRHRQAQAKGGFGFGGLDFDTPSAVPTVPVVAEAKEEEDVPRGRGGGGLGFKRVDELQSPTDSVTSDACAADDSSDAEMSASMGSSLTDPLIYKINSAGGEQKQVHFASGAKIDRLRLGGEGRLPHGRRPSDADTEPSGYVSPPSGVTSMVDESPRIPLPVHRMQDLRTSPRPQTAEKRRWLARVSLLSSGGPGGGSGTSSSSSSSPSVGGIGLQIAAPESVGLAVDSYGDKLAKLAKADDEAVRTTFGSQKYFYLEYLEWMGFDMLLPGNDSGELRCSGCQNTLGNYYWSPSARQSLDGLLQAPVVRIHKSVVHEAAMVLDNTPTPTPRYYGETGSAGSNNDQE